MAQVKEPVVQVLLDPDWAQGGLVEDVRRGLGAIPRSLPPKWLYDDRGSELYDRITRLPEYYPTECERAILREHAADIAALSGATTMVELGSGTSDKTRTLLDAFTATGQLEKFVPVDVSEATFALLPQPWPRPMSAYRSRRSSETSPFTWLSCRAATDAWWPS